MSVFNQHSQYTLVELAKRTNNGNLLEIAEVLSITKEMFQDAVWVEANQTASHVGTKRTNLPSGTHRQANQGVASEASSTKQVAEPICRLEAHSRVDEAILDLAPDKAKARSQEDLAFVEGLGQTIETNMIYGDIDTNPEQIDGLATRYDATADANVIGASGTGDDTTSLWIIEWGPMKVHMIYPKGSQAGLQTEDMGKQLVTNDTGSTYFWAWFTKFVAWYGLYIHDDRCVQRIANIETSGIEHLLDDDDIIEALNLLPQAGGGGST
ncbi:MAG TPA: hypothetical protein DDY17_02360, partial [Syntrophaceae bacterium]|nr:hypothetical protein [Syntrophaceae bacterium]